MNVFPTGNEKCPKCGYAAVYFNKYDSLACTRCDIWLTDGCSEPNCQFCEHRPGKPSHAVNGSTVKPC